MILFWIVASSCRYQKRKHHLLFGTNAPLVYYFTFAVSLLISPHIVFGSNPTILFLSRNFSRYIQQHSKEEWCEYQEREGLWEENLWIQKRKPRALSSMIYDNYSTAHIPENSFVVNKRVALVTSSSIQRGIDFTCFLMMDTADTFFQLRRSKGSKPLLRANSEKNALRFSMSLQYPFGLEGGWYILAADPGAALNSKKIELNRNQLV